MGTAANSKARYDRELGTVLGRCRNMLKGCRCRAAKRGIECSITLEDIVDLFPGDGKCPVFGIDLSLDNSVLGDDSPSLDRLDNDKGYTKENCVVVSFKANRIKSTATTEDLELLLTWLKEYN